MGNKNAAGNKVAAASGTKRQLFTQAQAGNHAAVSVGVGAAQVGQQTAAGAHHFQQAAAAVMVFGVGFEVGGQVVNAESQRCVFPC